VGANVTDCLSLCVPCGWGKHAMEGCFTLKNLFLAAGLIITLVVCEGFGQ
jgi:hypothetical protein